MSLELTKKAQKVGLVLAKNGLTTPPIMRVAIAMDISGSMDDEFADGSVQKITDQLLGVGVKFDDDGSIDVFQFDDRADYVGTCTTNDYGSFIRTEGVGVRGGTAYSPVVRLMTSGFFSSPASAVGKRSRGQPGKPGGFLSKEVPPTDALTTSISDVPVLAFIITDGQPLAEGRDPGQQYRNILPAFEAAQSHPIYFQIVGINNQGEEFEVCQRLADDLPNVGFIKMNGFGKSDDDLYREVISAELVAWVKKFTPSAQATA